MIVVTTPTGNIGSKLVENLLASNQPIRLIARHSSKISKEIQAKTEIIEGSHGDGEVVNRAFQGADAVFWLVPPVPNAPSLQAAYVDFSRPACEAFKTHGVKRVVAVSALGRGTEVEKHAGLVTASLEMSDLIAATGVNLRALALPGFMDNMLMQVEAIKNQGMFFWPYLAERKSPTCATQDIAAAAARLLLDPSWTGQQEVPVLGPEDLSMNDEAQIMSEVLGKKITFQHISIDALKERLAGSGMSQAFIQGYAEMMDAKNKGLDDAVQRTPETSSPTSFRQWCEQVLKAAVEN